MTNPVCFKIAIRGVTHREFLFKAQTVEECMAWVRELNRHIDESDGGNEIKTAGDIKRPWRFDCISEKQFLEKADTGDVLLFKANSFNGGLIRTFTSSKFDHVAMILKFEADQGEVYIVESTGNRGVALNKWQYLRPHIGAKQFYKKAVFRHLDFERSNEMVDRLELFLKEAVG